MSKQRTNERLTLWLVLALFLAAAVNLNLFYARFDLTSTGAFTVSKASKDIVSQAKENIYVTYYLTKKLKTYSPLPQAIEDFLVEYANSTGGRVKVKVVDPVEAKEVDKVEKLGIQPNPMQVVEQNQQTAATVYSGLLIQYLDKQEILPLVFKTETIEYDLSAKINQLLTNKTRSVGILLGTSSKTLENSYRYLSQSLTKAGTFRAINPGEAIDPSLSVLIVAGGKDLTETDAYHVDQYLMAGGKVLFAVDGVDVDVQNMQPTSALNQPMVKLLSSYGINLSAELLNDPVSKVVPLGNMLTRYTLWPQLVTQDVSKTHPITSHFPGLDLMWASPIDVTAKDGVKAEPIAWTSAKSWLMKEPFSLDPNMTAFSAQNNPGSIKSHNVVWSLTGSFASTYTAATVPRKPGDNAPAAPLTKSPDTRVLAVGDSDFLSDLLQYSQSTQNITFVENAIEWLGQDETLLAIKSRPQRETSLNQIQDKNTRDSAAFFLSFVNLGVVPLALIGFWAYRFLSRRQRELKG